MRKHINRLGVRTASALVAMAFATQAAWALAPFKVQDIRVEGLQRVEPGTIFASLPLPVLDGGHLMYYLWEALTGRSVSDAWMERLQRGGVAVLLLMMSIALFNDLTRLFG